MVALSYLSFTRINRLNELSALVNHTNVVKLGLQETYSNISDADSEHSKFLLTGDSVYLKKMMDLENLAASSLTELKVLTQDNPHQQKKLKLLDSLIRERFTLMEVGLLAKNEDYKTIASNISISNSSILNTIAALRNEENNLLVQRENSVANYKSWTPVVIFAIEIGIIVFLCLAYFYVATELKVKAKLQTEIERQMHLTRAILDNSVDIIAVFDIEFNLVMMNKKAEEWFNISQNRIGKNIFDTKPDSRDSNSHEALRKAIKGEYVHIPRNKTALPDKIFESFFIPLSKDGKIYAAIAIHHDISDLVHTSLELERRNIELVTSNQQLEQFAYVASHDLQEPLRKIQTFANLAHKFKADDEKRNTYLSKISTSAARMSKLIRDVLNYSRLAEDKDAKEVVDLNEVWAQLLQDFELTIQEKKAVVTSDTLPTIKGSRQQIFQLFANLLSNSLKFCEKTPHISNRYQIENGKHIFHFIDNGIGFEQKYAQHVFEVFKRLHDQTSYSGTGIGLAICKRIIANHHGSIEVNSELGKGTMFKISLPLDDLDNIKKKDFEMRGEIASERIQAKVIRLDAKPA